ncbi:MAG: type II secretion system protein [Gemmatimonadaceae bacterium]|nr:type II secretion system protein [Gemmatimonadaceae bacterium]
MRTRRRGFSIPELLVVLTILGIVVRMGFPRYTELRRQAEARAIIGDVQAVRVAAYNYNTEHQDWPSEASRGSVPAELQPLLPQGFSFQRDRWTMDWEVWPGAGSGSPSAMRAGTAPLIALSVETPDTLLTSALRQAARLGVPYLVSGSETTFLLAGFGGSY